MNIQNRNWHGQHPQIAAIQRIRFKIFWIKFTSRLYPNYTYDYFGLKKKKKNQWK